MSHTPGPWTSQGMTVVALDADSVIHLPAMSNNTTTATLRANARLIAAAPDLLAALKYVQRDLAKIILGATNDVVDAAIAKAEGR